MTETKKQAEAEQNAAATQPTEGETQEQEQAPKEKVEYTRPTSQLDLERRLANDNNVEPAGHLRSVNPSDALDLDDEGDDGFVGVDPVYRNYANETEKPMQADEGPEAKAEELHWRSVYGEPTVENEAVKENLKTIQSATADLNK